MTLHVVVLVQYSVAYLIDFQYDSIGICWLYCSQFAGSTAHVCCFTRVVVLCVLSFELRRPRAHCFLRLVARTLWRHMYMRNRQFNFQSFQFGLWQVYHSYEQYFWGQLTLRFLTFAVFCAIICANGDIIGCNQINWKSVLLSLN